MFVGTHVVVYSRNPDADRKFLRDVLQLGTVDAGGGYLIFALPSAEASLHEAGSAEVHPELYLMCRDINEFVALMQQHDVATDPVQKTDWGLLTNVKLPGGSKLGVYQPLHQRPAQ